MSRRVIVNLDPVALEQGDDVGAVGLVLFLLSGCLLLLPRAEILGEPLRVVECRCRDDALGKPPVHLCASADADVALDLSGGEVPCLGRRNAVLVGVLYESEEVRLSGPLGIVGSGDTAPSNAAACSRSFSASWSGVMPQRDHSKPD